MNTQLNWKPWTLKLVHVKYNFICYQDNGEVWSDGRSINWSVKHKIITFFHPQDFTPHHNTVNRTWSFSCLQTSVSIIKRENPNVFYRMFSLYRGPKGIFYAHLLSKFALKPPQYLDRRWQKYGEESLQRENNFIWASSYRYTQRRLSNIIYFFVQEVDILTLFSVWSLSWSW